MTVDANFETLYSQIELVRGAGNRRRGQLCVMSLAAFLAGEGHSDNPASASPLIRRWAMTLNDEIPVSQRQKLKPFAPLIIGTRDGRDGDRASLLIAAARTELLPRIEAEFGHVLDPDRVSHPGRDARIWPDVYQRVIALVASADLVLDAAGCEEIAFAVARLICHCGQTAPLPQQRAWYWAKAVDLLDRLCIIGITDERPAISAEHLDALAAFLERRRNWNVQRQRVVAALELARKLIPALVR